MSAEKKKKSQFTILSNDSTDGHGGFGVGTLNLNNISPVIIHIDEGTAEVDMGALHARSAVERGIKFLREKDDVADGKAYWLVWVAIDYNDNGEPLYAGVTACYMLVKREIRRGYKNLAEHVNYMDKSLKRKIIVSHMDDRSKQILMSFLKEHDIKMWERSSDQLKRDLSDQC